MQKQPWSAMTVLLTILLVSCTLAPPKNTAVKTDEPSQPLPAAVEEALDAEVDSTANAEPPSAAERLIDLSTASKCKQIRAIQKPNKAARG